jgi:thiol-disulfide isomerase/thioredoxin
MMTISLLVLTVLLAACGKTQSSNSMKGLSSEKQELAASIEDLGNEHVHMPKLPWNYRADEYHNGTANEIEQSLKGKIVLIDIWDYTCVNCIRTLPYITAWHEKYTEKGLVILGVHTPEFDFEKDPENLRAAVKRFGLTYPVIADNNYEIWHSLANRYWPAKYIFDANGILRAQHFGEGHYQEFEAFIQKLLYERDSTIELPDLTPHVREADKAGAVCYRPTPELYLGFERNKLGNREAFPLHKPTKFIVSEPIEKDAIYLSGEWQIENEYAKAAGNGESAIQIDYEAKEANLVIRPQGEGEFRVKVEQDGKPVAKADRGTDIVEEGGHTYLVVSESKMYNITNNSTFGRHLLKLSSSSALFGAYAFTFTTDCKE